MNNLIRIVYISVATKPFSEDDLLHLLAKCRSSNTEKSITGQLIYSDGSFMQVLEGPEAAIDATYNKIKDDPRHKNVQLIERDVIQERQFRDWSMGFKSLSRDELHEIEGYNYQFDDDENSDNPFANKVFVAELMKHVKQQYVSELSNEDAALQQTEKSLLGYLNKAVHYAVLLLATLMAFVVMCGVAEVATELYLIAKESPAKLMTVGGLTSTISSFLAVLIAIDIFINISLYVRKHMIAVRLVVATALMAVARKIIVLEFNQIEAMQVMALAALVAGLGFCYYFLSRLRS
jgi:uncharacterized membrane protein (DUF373 family)